MSDRMKPNEVKTLKENNLTLLKYSAIITTIVVEVATVLTRFVIGISAAEFNQKNPPLFLKIHHMFWSIPLFAIAILFCRKRFIWQILTGIGIGLGSV